MNTLSVVVECEGGTAELRLNRTRALNAIDAGMADELRSAWSRLAADAGVTAIVLTGSGPEAFCIGYDVDEPPTRAATADMRRVTDPRAFGVRQPLVVAVNGIACREAFAFLDAADHVVTAPNARFFEPAPGGGARSSRVEGAGAKTTVLTGEQAQARGVVDEVVALRELRAHAARIAARVAPASPTTRLER